MPKVQHTVICRFCKRSFTIDDPRFFHTRKFCSRGCIAKHGFPQRKQTSLAERFRKYVGETTPTGCILWTGKPDGSNGYGRITVGKAGEGRIAAHRLAWELVNGPIPPGMKACHRCDNPLCVNPDHIFLGTDADNVADRDAKGRTNAPKGEQHGLAKFTDEQVREIRRQFDCGETTRRQLERRFGVSRSTIRRIVTRTHWKHVA